jgi:hypothetical protein
VYTLGIKKEIYSDYMRYIGSFLFIFYQRIFSRGIDPNTASLRQGYGGQAAPRR